MKKVVRNALIAIVLALSLSACTNTDDANKALSAMAFTNIQYTGYKIFACSRDDWYDTGFKAINTVGKPVDGVV